MFSYILRRLWQMIPTLAGVILLIFFLFKFFGGDPDEIMAGLKSSPERIASLRAQLGLDKPVSDAYAKLIVKGLITADDAEIRARRSLQSGLMRALPPKKAARYLQLEAKIRAVQAYDIAIAIPLIK